MTDFEIAPNGTCIFHNKSKCLFWMPQMFWWATISMKQATSWYSWAPINCSMGVNTSHWTLELISNLPPVAHTQSYSHPITTMLELSRNTSHILNTLPSMQVIMLLRLPSHTLVFPLMSISIPSMWSSSTKGMLTCSREELPISTLTHMNHSLREWSLRE